MTLGAELPLWTVAPFAALLVSIAVLPLAAPHFWERNRNKALIAGLCALPVAATLAIGYGSEGRHELLDKLREYVSFMTLLASLFVISGGIHVGGSLSGTPLVNTAILALGAVIANVIGTTG